MKYTLKLAGGGGITFTPYINPAPQQSTSTSTQASSSEKSGEEGVMNDKIYEKLMGAGLVNDVNDFATKMTTLQQDYFGASNTFGAKPMINYLQQIAKVNQLMENKKAWDSAVATSEKTGGYGETAIGTNNEVYTRRGDGQIQAISLNTYKENKGKVKLLTVSELLNARNFEAQLTGQNGVFEVANTSIGMNKISDHVQSIVSMVKLASDSTDFYATKDMSSEIAKITGSRKPTQKELDALSSITADGSYKITSSSKQKDLTTALNYIWSTLGESAQRKLELITIMEGKEDSKTIIKELLTASYAPESDVSISEVKDTDGNRTGKNGEAVKNIALSPTELFHSGKLNITGNNYDINNNKGTKMSIHASSIGPLLNLKNNEQIGVSTVANALTQGGLGILLDINKAYLGDIKINPIQLQNLVYNGQDVAQVLLPVKDGGLPDFESMQEFKDLMAVYEANKDKESIKVAEKRFHDAGFNIYIDAIPGKDGKITKVIRDNKYVKPFLAIPTLTNSATEFADNKNLVRLIGDNADIATNLMEQAWTFTSGTTAKPIIKKVIPKGTLSLERPLAGMTYIAYRPDASAQIAAINSHLYGPAAGIADIQRNLQEDPNMTGNKPVSANAKKLIE